MCPSERYLYKHIVSNHVQIDGRYASKPNLFRQVEMTKKHGINIKELQHEISNNVVCATSIASDQPAHTV